MTSYSHILVATSSYGFLSMSHNERWSRWAPWVDYLQCTLCCLLLSPNCTDFYRTVVLLILNQIIGNSETFSLRFNQLEWCDTSTRVYQFSTLGWGYLGQGTVIWVVFGVAGYNQRWWGSWFCSSWWWWSWWLWWQRLSLYDLRTASPLRAPRQKLTKSGARGSRKTPSWIKHCGWQKNGLDWILGVREDGHWWITPGNSKVNRRSRYQGWCHIRI